MGLDLTFNEIGKSYNERTWVGNNGWAILEFIEDRLCHPVDNCCDIVELTRKELEDCVLFCREYNENSEDKKENKGYSIPEYLIDDLQNILNKCKNYPDDVPCVEVFASW